MAPLSSEEIRKLKVSEIKDELIKRGLDSNGLKAALTQRLEAAIATQSVNAAEPDFPVAEVESAPHLKAEKSNGRKKLSRVLTPSKVEPESGNEGIGGVEGSAVPEGRPIETSVLSEGLAPPTGNGSSAALSSVSHILATPVELSATGVSEGGTGVHAAAPLASAEVVPSSEPSAFGSKGVESRKDAASTPGSKPGSAEEVSGATIQDAKDSPSALGETEKKQKRAERFGTQLQTTEEEKRRLRSEKFQDEGEKQENRKLAARAERFGIPSPKEGDSANTDKSKASDGGLKAVDPVDAAKRAARLQRFGPLSSPPATSSSPTAKPTDSAAAGGTAEAKDSSPKVTKAAVEEMEKKKAARRERFGISGGGQGAKTVSPEEAEKIKKRAERFGMLGNTDEELEKRKKLRAEKFAVTKPTPAPSTTVATA